MRPPDEMLHEQREWLRVTLSSIGDAVITTDNDGKVTFLNPVAEKLTGWPLHEAIGTPLESVFRIVNEETRRAVESPATRALREGLVVGLANHTLLLARNGCERPIDDSAAPLRDLDGNVSGVVLVFRDVTERRHQENQLRESEERFRLLIESVKDYAIFMLDPNGTVISWNAGAERIKGYSANEIIGSHFSRFYPPDVVARGFPSFELEIATKEGRFEDNGWRVRKDGTRFWANVVITAVRDESGTLRGFAKVTRDLTERKRAEEALRSRESQIRALTQSANDAIISADEAGNIVFWNAAATTTFGYTESEALGRPLAMLMPERYREAHQQGLERLLAGGQAHLLGKTIELEGLRKDGSEFPIELSLAAWSTDEGRFYTGIVRNIAERKQLERAKAQSEMLADLNRRKDEFLAMLSHELRNPLAPISTAVQLLRLDKDDDPSLQPAMSILERQVTHLTRLVDDLLEVSRISTGRIRLQPDYIDLRRIAERAVEAVRLLSAQREHEFVVSLPAGPVWLQADAVRIEQVLVNLLVNAVKYTDVGGRIELSLEQDGEQAVVRVKDTGVGIAPDLLPTIFDLFTQAERSLDRSQGGLGVGLTIVRRIVELHGGSVSAFSEGLGRGSEFVVRLPLAEARTSRPSAAPNDKGPARPGALRLLVVDDNKDAANSIAMLLRAFGYEVKVAYSGASAIETALTFQPHAAFLDIGMPEMDGYEVARHFRQDPQLHRMRLAALTGYGRESDQQHSHEAGFDTHMIKPVEPKAIHEFLAPLTTTAE